jgi:hypothetical protein
MTSPGPDCRSAALLLVTFASLPGDDSRDADAECGPIQRIGFALVFQCVRRGLKDITVLGQTRLNRALKARVGITGRVQVVDLTA